MKFNIPADWSMRKALLEASLQTVSFSVRSPFRSCPACRGYDLERQWCDVCKGYGYVDAALSSQRGEDE